MKLTRKKMKVLVLSVAMGLIMAVPNVTNAQSFRSDGFFSGMDDGYENRDELMTSGVTNDSFAPVSLDGGLMIMVAAGIWYAVNRFMKFKNQNL